MNFDAENTIKMNPAVQTITTALRAARVGKGLSQRDLSAMTGVPQGQISRIEAGAVDPRASTLLTLAHALDMELVLVPRQAVSAVRLIAKPSMRPSPTETRPAYSLDESGDEEENG